MVSLKLMYMLSGIMYIMGQSSIRHKHLRIDQAKLDKARRVLAARTETEALDRALTLVVSEGEVDKALRQVAGRTRLKKAFR